MNREQRRNPWIDEYFIIEKKKKNIVERPVRKWKLEQPKPFRYESKKKRKTNLWNLYSKKEKRNLLIYIIGIMFYKFGLEAFNGSIVSLATNRYDRDAFHHGYKPKTFEQIGFPLAIETVLRDSSIRTKTLSAAQIHPSSASGNYKSQDLSLAFRTTLSDQYLHMMLEHAIRFNDEDLINEESYLHVLTYLIDTLAKTSDENFCSQTSSLLLKCSVEYSHQPLIIPTLFWHIWFRCSTHLISILNRSHTFELNNKISINQSIKGL